MSKEKPEMFLFVWTYFCPPYTDGMAFAIAETEEAAEQLISSKRETVSSLWGPVERHPVTDAVAFFVDRSRR
jgi:hypothetical protein